MIILGIETSCDETALSIIEIGAEKNADDGVGVKIIANQVLSQIELHKQYGGVFPMLAKREHGKNLVPLLKKTLEEANFLVPAKQKKHSDTLANIGMDWEHDAELKKSFLEFIPTIDKPPVDLISVTAGPGLEPCLWTGLNFAKALSVSWNIPTVAANHMEGHMLVALLQAVTSEKFKVKSGNKENSEFQIQTPNFPALALLISGGHTELVLMKNWLEYEIVGRTRDDAAGEAFDKVARILGLPYPGGPEISRLADSARKSPANHELKLPRPMLHSDNLDFSFSGLKTAVLYLVKKLPAPLDEKTKAEIALEFEDAVTDVIISKIKQAIETFGIQTLILGGGVVANAHIREETEKMAREQNITLKLPVINHATDNALMIALAGYFNRKKAFTEKTGLLSVKANGNLSFQY